MNNINWPEAILNFIAVILGVFLAFQIESSAADAREEKELEEIIQSFVKELENDHRNYVDYQIPSNEAISASIDTLLILIKGGEEGGQLNLPLDLNNYSPVSSTYSSVVSSGKFSLIKDLQIKKGITNYYESLSSEAEQRGQVQVEYFLKEIIPWLVANTDLLNVELEDFLEDDEFANLLLIYKGLIDNKISQYELVAAEADTLAAILRKFTD